MKYQTVLLLSLLFAVQNSSAIKLNEQIRQNVDQAQKSYEQLIKQEQPSLWIHVRTVEQQKLVEKIPEWLKRVALVKIEPIQIVKTGPKKTQLRFFSIQDKEKAEDLFKKMQKVFPQLELQDLSNQYSTMGWMEAGHFELWLAPDLKKITQPELLPPRP
jgi:hypothetical protein